MSRVAQKITGEPTIADLEEGLLISAELVHKFGDDFMPYFTYMEAELAKAKAKAATMDRVTAVLKASPKRVTARATKSHITP